MLIRHVVHECAILAHYLCASEQMSVALSARIGRTPCTKQSHLNIMGTMHVLTTEKASWSSRGGRCRYKYAKASALMTLFVTCWLHCALAVWVVR